MKVLFQFLSLFFLAACSTQAPVKIEKQAGFLYSKLASIEEKESYKLLSIRNPKTLQIETQFALYKGKTPNKIPRNIKPIQIPVKNMGALSASFIGMIDAINGIESVKATSELQYVYNKKLRKKLQKNQILSSSYETGLSAESLLKKHISLIVYSGFGQPYPQEEKLAQLGITCMANYDWEETHPLGKAEWIKVFGALLDKEKEAETYFNMVEKNYLELKKKALNISTKKKTICGSITSDVWYAPAGESFMAGILNDAGLDYIYKNTKGTASIQITPEQAFKDQQNCSVWINADAVSLKELEKQNPKYALFHVFKSGSVYSYFNNTNYFWEISPANPHWLLEDYINIVKGKTELLHFYKKLH